jgi:hypothetical protein
VSDIEADSSNKDATDELLIDDSCFKFISWEFLLMVVERTVDSIEVVDALRSEDSTFNISLVFGGRRTSALKVFCFELAVYVFVFSGKTNGIRIVLELAGIDFLVAVRLALSLGFRAFVTAACTSFVTIASIKP